MAKRIQGERPQLLPSLTGVRGVAAIWVFLTHVTGLAALVLHAPGLNHSLFLFNGFRGVDLFLSSRDLS